MTREKKTIAKISRPRISGLMERQRLFRVLDRESARPILWVSSPAGSGKTSLIAGYLEERKLPCVWYQVDQGDGDLAGLFYYLGLAAKHAAPRFRTPLPLLTPEYLAGLPAFTKRFFENLFNRLKPGSVLVFDNYQDAPPGSGFHEALQQGLSAVPEGIRVIVISRNEPPAAFARYRASQSMGTLSWSDLRFTLEETRALVWNKDGTLFPDQSLKKIHDTTDGWAAGLVLMLNRAEAGVQEPQTSGEHTPDEIFDYFAWEVFGKLDSDTRDLLLMASFLPRMTARTVAALTGNDHASAILSGLNRNHFFTNRLDGSEAIYQFHPLFRNFLLARGTASLSPDGLLRMRKKAATLLEDAGQTEDAVELYLEAADWDGALSLILVNAAALAAQGRRSTLAGWLQRIPKETLDSVPWALYWLGVSRMYVDPYEGRNYLARAFKLFKSVKDRTGLFQAWIRVGETIFFAWGESRKLWIGELETILAEDPTYPTPEIEVQVSLHVFIAVMSGIISPIPDLLNKITAVVLHGTNTAIRIQLGHYLMIYHLWIGEFAAAGSIMRALKLPDEKAEETPPLHLTWYAMQAMYAWWSADQEACMSAVRKGLSLSESTGVHFMDVYLYKYGVSASVSLGYHDEARELMQRMSTRPRISLMDTSFYHYLSALVAWSEGNAERAVQDNGIALGMVGPLEHRIPRFCCQILQTISSFDTGRFDDARLHLDSTGKTAEGCNFLEYVTGLFSARFAFDQGSEEEGLVLLRQAMAIGAKQGYLNFAYWRPEMMARLCARALHHDIEVEYVRMMIRKRNLIPGDAVENWPYVLKVNTLGRFELLLNDAPLTFSGKVQKKPLEMLKVLISFGGADVAEDRIAEALWPDAEGDLAHRSFETTLYRLRNLIGDDKVLRLQDGLLSLDSRYCRSDQEEFERLVARAEASWNALSKTTEPGNGGEDAVAIAETAIGLYRGHFLPADIGQAWSVSMRERLRTRFVQILIRVGSYWEQAGNWSKAAECFERGVEVDDLVEEFYRHLMVCRIQQGQRAMAITVYKRCSAALRREFNIDPSLALEELSASLGSNPKPEAS